VPQYIPFFNRDMWQTNITDLNPVHYFSEIQVAIQQQLEMWANAQCDGRPAEYRWRPLFSAAKFD